MSSVRERGLGFEGVKGEVIDGLDVACADASESERGEGASATAGDHQRPHMVERRDRFPARVEERDEGRDRLRDERRADRVTGAAKSPR
jgi:hypothetical protein